MPRNMESEPRGEDESDKNEPKVFDTTEGGDYEAKENDEGILEITKKKKPKKEKKPTFHEKAKQDAVELEKLVRGASSDILIEALNGKGPGLTPENLMSRTKESRDRKMDEIQTDGKTWAEQILQNERTRQDYIEFLKIHDVKRAETLEKFIEGNNDKTAELLTTYYVMDRMDTSKKISDRWYKKEIEREKPVENPYQEIVERLIEAQEKLQEEGLNDDAENLGKTIQRIQNDIDNEKEPKELVLWYSTTNEHKREEPKGTLGKIISWAEKLPVIGNIDYRKPVRDKGGTIIRKDGTLEEFYTFTRFKKKGEKVTTGEPSSDKYHDITEPQPGDEIVSWEPSKEAAKIIMESVGGHERPPNENDFSSSMGESNIKYRADESDSFTENVKYNVDRNRDVEVGQIYSSAILRVSPAPRNKKEN